MRGWVEEIHSHIPTPAEGRLELLQHQKYFAVVQARLASMYALPT